MIEKYINFARDYAKENKNNNIGIYDFLKNYKFHNRLNEYEKKHYVSKIKNFFQDDVEDDDLLLFIELIDLE